MYCGVAAFLFLSLWALNDAQCPADSCKLPDCRCFSDGTIPGGLARNTVPQMVLIVMGYQLNSEYSDVYQKLFTVTNPNNCPIRGSFFVQDAGSNYALAKQYSDLKYEIGIQTDSLVPPSTQKEWDDAIKKVKDNLIQSGIDETSIQGFRATALTSGGMEEYTALGVNKLSYTIDCVTTEFDGLNLYKWPFTLDYPDPHDTCTSGALPGVQFPGKWQFMVPALIFNGTKCASAAGCAALIKTKLDAYDIFYNNFVLHYEGNRAPFIVEIDPSWVQNQDYLDGTIQFIEYIRAAFDDTWVVTVGQALEWTKTPVPLANIMNFPPFQCT